MEEQKEDFLTPEERTILGPKETDNSYIEKSNISELETRPTIITVLCGYFFVSWCLSILSYITLFFRAQNVPFYLSGISGLTGWLSVIVFLLMVVGIIGYWFMKKWAVYLYLITILASFAYVLFQSKFYFFGFIMPLAVIIIGLKYLNSMS